MKTARSIHLTATACLLCLLPMSILAWDDYETPYSPARSYGTYQRFYGNHQPAVDETPHVEVTLDPSHPFRVVGSGPTAQLMRNVYEEPYKQQSPGWAPRDLSFHENISPNPVRPFQIFENEEYHSPASANTALQPQNDIGQSSSRPPEPRWGNSKAQFEKDKREGRLVQRIVNGHLQWVKVPSPAPTPAPASQSTARPGQPAAERTRNDAFLGQKQPALWEIDQKLVWVLLAVLIGVLGAGGLITIMLDCRKRKLAALASRHLKITVWISETR